MTETSAASQGVDPRPTRSAWIVDGPRRLADHAGIVKTAAGNDVGQPGRPASAHRFVGRAPDTRL